ncbi:MAG: alpha/beta hydrolase [Ilumatobacteraceae bacterium]
MANRPEFIEFDVDGAALGALRWPGLSGAPTVIAVHGITANAWAWDPLAHHLAGAAEIVAVDLRGRGRSHEQPGPWGMRQHADDIAAIIEQIGGPLVLVGHSMGAYVVQMTAERHPAAVRDLVLVDGGTALPRPPDDQADAALDAGLGPVMERLRTIWPDRVSYQAMWAQHPAFVDGIGPDLERNLLADLIEVDGGFRTAVDEDAVRHDGGELLLDDEVRTLLDRRQQPVTIVRAEFGMFGTPPPFIPADLRDRYPQHRWIEATGLNHYTTMNSSTGASLIAGALRDALTSS